MRNQDWDDSELVDAYDRAIDAYKTQRQTQRQQRHTDEVDNHHDTQHHAHTNTHGQRRRPNTNLEYVEYKWDTEDQDNKNRTRATTTGDRVERSAPHSASPAYADTWAPPPWAENAPAYCGSGSSYAAPSSSTPPPPYAQLPRQPYAQLPRAGAAAAEVGGVQQPDVPGMPMPGAWPPGLAGPSVPNVAASGGGTEDGDLANLMLAWYHCGFFTARYQERRSRP